MVMYIIRVERSEELLVHKAASHKTLTNLFVINYSFLCMHNYHLNSQTTCVIRGIAYKDLEQKIITFSALKFIFYDLIVPVGSTGRGGLTSSILCIKQFQKRNSKSLIYYSRRLQYYIVLDIIFNANKHRIHGFSRPKRF